MTKTASIVGGSISGLIIANLLFRSGWKVNVFEQSSRQLSDRGAGIVCHPKMITTFSKLGINMPELGTWVEKRVYVSKDNETNRYFDYPQLVVSWNNIYSALLEKFPREHYHLGKTLSDVTTQSNYIRAVFNNTEYIESDLIIGADGIRSRVRDYITHANQPKYAGYIVWRAVSNLEGVSDIRKKQFTFYMDSNQQILGYPIQRNNMQSERYNLVWYKAIDQNALDRFLVDKYGKKHEYSVPPNRTDSNLIVEMLESASTELPHFFSNLINKSKAPFVSPVYDILTDRFSTGRVVLVGDAAAVARPHVGMGVTKALLDCVALHNKLEKISNIEEALSDYGIQQHRFADQIVNASRHLGSFIQKDQHSLNNELKGEEISYIVENTADYQFAIDEISDHYPRNSS